MAYGTPRRARRDRGVLHRHPPGPAADAGAAGRPRPAATRRSAASRRSPTAPRRSATRCRPRSTSGRPGDFVVGLGLKHADPKVEAGVGGARRRRRRAHRRAGAGPALLVDVDRRVPRPGRRRRRRRRRAVRRHRELGHRAGLRRRSSPPRCAAGWPRCRRTPRSCSPPTRCRSGSSPTGDPYPDELRATADGRRRRRRPRPRGRSGRSAWQSAGRTPEPWLGPDILAVDRRAGRRRATPTACSCARAGSSPTTSRCSTTSTSRPGGGPRAGPGVRPHGVDERRPDRASARSPIACRRRRHDEPPRRRRRRRDHRAGRRPRARRVGDARHVDDRGPGGRRPARRQDPHVAVRRPAGRRRGRRRLPRPRARRHRARARGRARRRADLADRRHAPPCGSTGSTRSPRACCSACPPTSLRLSTSRAAVDGGARCAPRSSRCCRAAIHADSIGALVRGRLRRRGPRAPRRRARRQHLRRRHRPLQPGDGPAARRPRRPRAQPAARAPGVAGRARRRRAARSSCAPRGGMARARRRRRPPRPRRRRDDPHRAAGQRRSPPTAPAGASTASRSTPSCWPRPPRPTAPLLAAAAPDAAAPAGARWTTPASSSSRSPSPNWPERAARAQRLPRAEAGAAHA